MDSELSKASHDQLIEASILAINEMQFHVAERLLSYHIRQFSKSAAISYARDGIANLHSYFLSTSHSNESENAFFLPSKIGTSNAPNLMIRKIEKEFEKVSLNLGSVLSDNSRITGLHLLKAYYGICHQDGIRTGFWLARTIEHGLQLGLNEFEEYTETKNMLRSEIRSAVQVGPNLMTVSAHKKEATYHIFENLRKLLEVKFELKLSELQSELTPYIPLRSILKEVSNEEKS